MVLTSIDDSGRINFDLQNDDSFTEKFLLHLLVVILLKGVGSYQKILKWYMSLLLDLRTPRASTVSFNSNTNAICTVDVQ